jgi:hypothetical protein
MSLSCGRKPVADRTRPRRGILDLEVYQDDMVGTTGRTPYIWGYRL